MSARANSEAAEGNIGGGREERGGRAAEMASDKTRGGGGMLPLWSRRQGGSWAFADGAVAERTIGGDHVRHGSDGCRGAEIFHNVLERVASLFARPRVARLIMVQADAIGRPQELIEAHVEPLLSQVGVSGGRKLDGIFELYDRRAVREHSGDTQSDDTSHHDRKDVHQLDAKFRRLCLLGGLRRGRLQCIRFRFRGHLAHLHVVQIHGVDRWRWTQIAWIVSEGGEARAASLTGGFRISRSISAGTVLLA